jgi:transcriptional regulator with XRE-family HTH domain
MARQLGIDESILSKIIHGHRQPSEAQRKLLASFLGSDESWLFEKYESSSNVNSGSHSEISDGTKNDHS